MKRIFLIVLDSFGIGEAPDAGVFGDEGANTLKSIFSSGELCVPNLINMGLANIEGVSCIPKTSTPLSAYARMREISAGKDTTVGHWEIAGLVSERPLPTYPDGFPSEIISEFELKTERKVLCNKPYSGTDVIRDYGEEHIKSGDLIVYTSADSVFQIAAHENVVPTELLYEYCRIARSMLVGRHGVGRVIARPFSGENGNFVRTADRHDFSIEPSGTTLLDNIISSGLDVISVGKINDIFASRGIKKHFPSRSNNEGMEITKELLNKDFKGLCFVNLVDFDSVYGHRNDSVGYARAINSFDRWIPSFISEMNDDDAVIITADHGCDPGDLSTDHTREYTPLLVYGKRIIPVDLGTRSSFADIAASIADMLCVTYTCSGNSFADKILDRRFRYE